jgi:hypothetical protein
VYIFRREREREREKKGGGGRKAIPITGSGGLKHWETSRIPHFVDNRLTDGGKAIGLTCRPWFTPQENSWYSFLLEAESILAPQCSWKDSFDNSQTESKHFSCTASLLQSPGKLRSLTKHYKGISLHHLVSSAKRNICIRLQYYLNNLNISSTDI